MHLGLPYINLECNVTKLLVGVVLGGLQDAVQVMDPVVHSNCHLLTFSCCLWALVKGGTKTFTDFSDSAAELVPLEEENKNHFVLHQTLCIQKRINILMEFLWYTYSGGVFKRFIYLSSPQENITTTSSP